MKKKKKSTRLPSPTPSPEIMPFNISGLHFLHWISTPLSFSFLRVCSVYYFHSNLHGLYLTCGIARAQSSLPLTMGPGGRSFR